MAQLMIRKMHHNWLQFFPASQVRKMSLFKSIALLLLVSSSILSTSSAGRSSVIVNNNSPKKAGAEARETKEALLPERLLRVNTQDYGTYDPAPTFAKPRSKLIPN